MSSETDASPTTPTPYRGDDRFLIPGILAMFAVAVLGSSGVLAMDHIVTATFLASGVAMLVFRFLGGINADTSFGVGAFRVGGSLAALVGCAWFFNGELRSTDVDTMFEPSYTSWVPINRGTGEMVPLKVNGEALPFPNEGMLSPMESVDLTILEGGKVAPSVSRDQPLGAIDSTDLKSVKLTIQRKDIYDFTTSRYMHAQSGPYEIPGFPFKIHVGAFDHDESMITIFNEQGTEVFNSAIYRRDYKLFDNDGSVYLVGINQLDHDGYRNAKGDTVRPYVRLSMGNLSKSVDLMVP